MSLRRIPNEPCAFSTEMDAVILALADTAAIVLDIRINQGGSDATALEIASHFTTEPYVAFTKRAAGRGGEEVEIHVTPRSQELQYKGSVVVIISRETYSAAETLPLAMMPLSQVTLLGENTGGSYSELNKALPNGWFFSGFSEEYLSVDGLDYDQVGVPPHVSAETDLLP